MDEEPEVVDSPGAQPPRRRSTATSASTAVRFGYGTGPEVLHGIDLDVPAGTTVALVGHTGAGQVDDRQAARPLLRPAERARSRSTALDLRDVTQEALRRQLGIVPQEGFLFAGTVHENIAFGRPDATRRGDRRGRRARRRRGRVHPRARGRLRHRARRARQPPLARPAPARRLRARAARRPAHPDPRRGDVVASTSAPSGGSSARCAACSPAARRSSSPTASRRSATPT